MTTARLGRALRLVAPLVVLATIPAGPSRADDSGESLLGYEAAATGAAFTASPRIPALLPVEAPFEATVSLATATLSSGGQGFGRASTFFPGTPIAGIRPLIEIAGGPRLPTPDYPLVVESREFEDPKRDDHPGITMSSDVDPDRALVIADAGGLAVEAMVTIASARTVSTALVDGNTVSSSTTSTITGVDIAGAISIGSIVSTASVVSDARSAVCKGDVTLADVSVGGQPATIDDAGLHIGDQPAVPGPGSGQPVGDALAPSGIEVRTLGGAETCDGASGNRQTGGLLVSIPLPEAGSVPPGGRFDIILASTAASAAASTQPAFELPPIDTPPVFGDVVTRLPGPIVGGGPTPVSAAGGGTEPRQRVEPPTSSAGSIDARELAAYTFEGVPMTLLLGLGYLTLPGARRVRRYMARVTALLDST
ncbi:MAG: hypothetical protein ACOYXM_03235 [Actinomycetota bacterium]